MLRRSPLPDFLIGAHAEVEGMTLLTRDAARNRTQFSKIEADYPKNRDVFQEGTINIKES